MLPELDDYNWAEVFGEGDGGNCSEIKPDAAPGSAVDKSTFTRNDVVRISGQVEGENDGDDWVVWGQLRDGRYFLARGRCDYTGWGCRADNSGNVATTADELIRFGMNEGERKRFKHQIPGDPDWVI